jgi:predicted dehydrogenase
MIRIGLVDLDTSHPQAFTTILNAVPGVQVAALCDHHDVWPEEYGLRFAHYNGITHVCKAAEEMVPLVDAAMVHAVNWDAHLDRALPFLRAGKPVLIDKPVVGSLADCRRLEEYIREFPGLLFGGSSLRFAEEVRELKAQLDGSGAVVSVNANGPGDFFSYGIHTTEMAQAVLGRGATEVAYIGGTRSTALAVSYGDGPLLLLQLGLPAQEWTLCVHTESRSMLSARVDPARLYAPFLRAFLEGCRGERTQQPETIQGALEAVKIHLAADQSRRTGRTVALEEIAGDAAFDGGAFASEYAAGKRKGAAS